jgi:hypothetical protein
MLGELIYSRRDSEYWHGKAVEIAISFLPSESPLVSHILMSYEKHHSPSNQSIVSLNFILIHLIARGWTLGNSGQSSQIGQGCWFQ